MSLIEHSTPGASSEAAARPVPSAQRVLALRVARLQAAIVDRAWDVLHVLGAHRWSEGYEIDAERGMTRYRGSRCAICDSPWEGW